MAFEQQRSRRLGERRVAVRRDVVRDTERIARDAVEEVAFDRFDRRVGDRMHQPVETVPVRREVSEDLVDLRVVGDVAGKNQRAVELGGELGDAIQKAFV